MEFARVNEDVPGNLCVIHCLLQIFPDVITIGKQSIPHGSFMTCSSDGTVRIWNIESGLQLCCSDVAAPSDDVM